VTRLHLVRHGRAAAGWDTDPDPGLDDIGRRQAVVFEYPCMVDRSHVKLILEMERLLWQSHQPFVSEQTNNGLLPGSQGCHIDQMWNLDF
jgi:hypothetical protein